MPFTKSSKGSVLVFSLIILAIVLSAALSITMVNVSNRKSATSTSQSVQSFQVADSATEIILKKVYQEGDQHTNLSLLAYSLPASQGDSGETMHPMCVSGTIDMGTVAGGTAKVTFFDNSSQPLACDSSTWRNDLARVKSEGVASGATRVVETSVSPCNSIISYTVDDGSGSAETGPQGVVSDGTNIWVADTGSGSVTKLLASTGEILHVYAVGNSPLFLAYDSSAAIWVTNSGSNNVTKIGIADDMITPIDVGAPSHGIAYDSDNEAMWVTLPGVNQVKKILVSNSSIPVTINTSLDEPRGIAFEPRAGNSDRIWVANHGNSTIKRFHASNGNSDGSGDSVSGAYGIIYDSFTTSLWITGLASGGSVVKMDTNGNISRTYSSNNDTTLGGIAFDSFGNSVWTTATPMNRLFTADATLRKSYVTTGLSHSSGIAFDASTNSIWFSNPTENKVTHIMVCK